MMSGCIAALRRQTILGLAVEPDRQYGIPSMGAEPFTSTAEGGVDRERLDLLVLTNANQCSGLYPHICIDPLLKMKSELQESLSASSAFDLLGAMLLQHACFSLPSLSMCMAETGLNFHQWLCTVH